MRKRLKKQYNTGGNTGIGADLGAGLLQGIGMGSQFGLPGAILGGAGGLFLGANQGIINRNNMIGYEDERKLREEQIAADEARLAAAQNSAILEQYPVEGTSTPRFTTGGDTEPVQRTHSLADLPPGVLQFVLDSPRLMEAAGTLSSDEMQRLVNQAGQAHDDLEGKTDLEKLGYFKDMDLSWVKPLREKAGLSKSDIINEAVDGGLIKKAMKYPVLGASMLKNFEYGGGTGGTVTPEQATASYTQPQFKQWYPSNMDLLREAFTAHNRAPDSTFENAMEMLDPTGISSWDDAYRANAVEYGTPYTADQTLDTVGALPLFGKGKTGFTLGKSALAKFTQGFKNDMARGYNMLKQGANYLNVADGLEDETGFLDGFAYGGETMGPQYEAEGGEMIQYKGGDKPRVYGKGGLSQKASNEFEIKGPSHANGGVDMSDEKGARIYSDKLTVDPSLIAKLMKL